MQITLTELKGNLGKYVEMSRDEDILITKNGKIISRLTEPFAKRKEKMEKQRIIKELIGSAKGEYMSLDDIRAERLARHLPSEGRAGRSSKQ
jgi:prevent-host-death family protein